MALIAWFLNTLLITWQSCYGSAPSEGIVRLMTVHTLKLKGRNSVWELHDMCSVDLKVAAHVSSGVMLPYISSSWAVNRGGLVQSALCGAQGERSAWCHTSWQHNKDSVWVSLPVLLSLSLSFSDGVMGSCLCELHTKGPSFLNLAQGDKALREIFIALINKKEWLMLVFSFSISNKLWQLYITVKAAKSPWNLSMEDGCSALTHVEIKQIKGCAVSENAFLCFECAMAFRVHSGKDLSSILLFLSLLWDHIPPHASPISANQLNTRSLVKQHLKILHATQSAGEWNSERTLACYVSNERSHARTFWTLGSGSDTLKGWDVRQFIMLQWWRQ